VFIYQLPDTFYRFYSVVDPDPGSGAFLTSRSGIRAGQPGSFFRELSNNFFGLKYIHSLMRIRDAKTSDPEWKKFESGMEKIRIRNTGLKSLRKTAEERKQ
jgi:hypothetical protein